MTKSLLTYTEYKEFLQARVDESRSIRGYLTLLAQAARCNKSYLSQVLRTKVHLTPEHAIGLSQYWEFNETETEYFLSLVHLGRTDNPALKAMLLRKLENLRKDQDHLGKRFSRSQLKEKREALYYSSWTYSAIHILLSIKEFQSISAISQKLSLPSELVRAHLLALEEMGIAKKSGGAWELEMGSVHLSKDSPMTIINHQNWRQRACLDSLKSSDGLHYTSVQSVSREDFQALKEMLLSVLDRARKVIEPSRSEELVCLNLDFFKV